MKENKLILIGKDIFVIFAGKIPEGISGSRK
jgi:hypothetical protein